MSFSPLSSVDVRGARYDVTTTLIVVHVVAMLLCALAFTTGYDSWLRFFVCTPESILQGQLWRTLTYPFYHNISQEHIWFALEMVMFFWFGREVEKTIGKTNFCLLYALLAFLPVLFVFLVSLGVGPFTLAGSSTLHFAIFIGFAILQPYAPFFFGLNMRWVGWIFLAIYSLVDLSQHNWIGLTQLLSSVGIVALALHMMRAPSDDNSWFRDWKAKLSERALAKQREKFAKREESFYESVDHILEKISRQGIHSLTPQEKQELEQARMRLLKKEKR